MIERRIVSFARSAVIIECDSTRATGIVDFLFREAPSDETIKPHVTFRVASGVAPDRLAIYRDGAAIYESNSDAELAEYLLGDATFALADKSGGGMVFHAGALVWNGCGILVPGAIGAGKTTLTAWLVTRGLGYLTDEMVWVPEGDNSIHGFSRPLNVKNPSRVALQHVFDYKKYASQILSSDRMDLIPPGVLNPGNTQTKPKLGLIIFPQYEPEGDSYIQPLSKAQAGFALLQTLVNARNLPQHGFPEAARLAQLAPAYRIRYSHFGQIQEPIHKLLSAVDQQRNLC